MKKKGEESPKPLFFEIFKNQALRGSDRTRKTYDRLLNTGFMLYFLIFNAHLNLK